jgi:hypothetical protein
MVVDGFRIELGWSFRPWGLALVIRSSRRCVLWTADQPLRHADLYLRQYNRDSLLDVSNPHIHMLSPLVGQFEKQSTHHTIWSRRRLRPSQLARWGTSRLNSHVPQTPTEAAAETPRSAGVV